MNIGPQSVHEISFAGHDELMKLASTRFSYHLRDAHNENDTGHISSLGTLL